MTDANLRALERAAANGDPAAQAAALRARMRSGELGLEQVELAAYCGHAAARELVPIYKPGGPQPGALVIYKDLRLWTKGLGRWGHMVQVRAGLAAARVALGALCFFNGLHGRVHCDEDGDPCGEPCRRIAPALAAVQAWLDDPSEANRKRCFFRAASPYWVRGVVMAVIWDEAPRERAERIAGAASSAAQTTSEAAVLKAMQRELIAWALGQAS